MAGGPRHQRAAVSLWFKVRRVTVVLVAVVMALAALALPLSVAAATPSPAGATLAAACFVALAVPVAVGWGCGRGNGQLESVGVRPTRLLDFLLASAAVGGVSLLAYVLYDKGVMPAGAIAARAGLVYLALLLLVQPLVGWRAAAVMPTVYLLLVAVVGHGDDIAHPAPWAWIAADSSDRISWVLTAIVLVAGVGAYAVVKPRLGGE